MNECNDTNKIMFDAMEEQHQNQIYHSDNTNNGIEKGKDKVIEKNIKLTRVVLVSTKLKVV